MIKNADMSEDMQQDAVDCATQAMEKYNIEKDIAAYIKKVNRMEMKSILLFETGTVLSSEHFDAKTSSPRVTGVR